MKVLKILSRKEILTSIKGHNSVRNVRKMSNNLVSINAYTKLGKNLSRHYAVSDLGLHCLPINHKKTLSLYGLRQDGLFV